MVFKDYTLANRKLIMYPDLSVTGRLFGGRLLGWLDESIALLAMERMNTQRIVTKKVSEVNFLAPAILGDILEIWGKELKRGETSLAMHGVVLVKREKNGAQEVVQICDCAIVFVALDELGKPRKWH